VKHPITYPAFFDFHTGEIKDIRLAKDRDGRFKKIAFVEFATLEGV
jgi:RNA recognition motif-containing protein